MQKVIIKLFFAVILSVGLSGCDRVGKAKIIIPTGEEVHVTYRGGGKYYYVRFSPLLNVRSGPDYNYNVLGTLQNGVKVYVHGFSGDWALISYQENEAFVHRHSLVKKESVATEDGTVQRKPGPIEPKLSLSQILKKVFPEPLEPMEPKLTLSQKLKKAFPEPFSPGAVKAIYVIVIFLSVFLFIFRKIRGKGRLTGIKHLINLSFFACLCLVEITYVLFMQERSIAFFMPEDNFPVEGVVGVGWGTAIISFIVLALVVYNQIMCFFGALYDLQHNAGSKSFGFRLGAYSVPVTIIAVFICSFSNPENIGYIVTFLLIAQVIQIVIIFKKILPKGGLFQAILCVLVYFVGIVATSLVLVPLVLFAIFAVCFVLYYKYLGAGNKGKGTITYSDGRTEEADFETGLLGDTTFTGKETGNKVDK